MALNAQQKGKEGEREIARDLNALVDDLLRELGRPCQDAGKPRIQRNQNQSAVGGCDLSGTFDLAIEIKRQEQLSINTWWKQCVESANELGHKPVLIFRQNTAGGGRKNWRVITLVEIAIPGSPPVEARAEISYDDFKLWFKAWAREHLLVELHVNARPTVQLPAPDTSNDIPEVAPVRLRLPDLYAEV
jgi:hypothetical protein